MRSSRPPRSRAGPWEVDAEPMGGLRPRRGAYAYQLVPPQTQDRFDAIRALLDQEHAVARSGARTWQSRLVSEEHVTHILVVCDSPAQDLEVNRRVEEALRALEMGFSVTAPMPVEDDPPL